jgi:hypothetical protein
MRKVSDQTCREDQNTHFIYNDLFLQKYRSLRDNVEKYGTARQTEDGNIIRHLRTACWINKATNTHTLTLTENIQCVQKVAVHLGYGT